MFVSLYFGCLQSLSVVSLLMTISTIVFVTLSCVSSNTVGHFTFNDNIYKLFMSLYLLCLQNTVDCENGTVSVAVDRVAASVTPNVFL